MGSFSEILIERANRILAYSKISQIALQGLEIVHKDKENISPFTPLFKFMANHIPEHHNNHERINLPEYKVVGFLDGLTLIATVSEVESYFYDIVVSVLTKYPEKIGKSSFELKTILEMTSIQDVKRAAAERFASAMLFKKPNEYKKDLLLALSIDEKLNVTWPLFVEAKARRDIGVHNNWFVNDIYNDKIKEVGLQPSAETSLTVDGRYVENVRKNSLELMNIISDECTRRF